MSLKPLHSNNMSFNKTNWENVLSQLSLWFLFQIFEKQPILVTALNTSE